MGTAGKILLMMAIVLALVGGLYVLLAHLGLKHLPGDIVIRRGNVTVYLPLATAIVVSVLLTVLVNLLFGR